MKVLAITAFDRSGTTFLGKYIHQDVHDSLFIGELDKGLVFLATDSIARSCSCGKKLMECSIWPEVDAVVKVNRDAAHGSMLSLVFERIFAIQGARLVIDSSKSLAHMKSLVAALNDDVVLLHVVRNPKGVIYSRMKARMRRIGKGSHPKPQIARRYNLMMLYDSLNWSLSNLYIEIILKRKARHYYRICYERSEAQLPPVLKQFLDPETAVLKNPRQHHIIHGNRNRYTSEDNVIIDESWRENLTPVQRWAVDAVTFPVRFMFGYQFPPAGSRAQEKDQAVVNKTR